MRNLIRCAAPLVKKMVSEIFAPPFRYIWWVEAEKDRNIMSLMMAMLPSLSGGQVRSDEPLPAIVLKPLLIFGGNTDDGQLVRGVAIPFFEILRIIQRDPNSVYQIGPRKWEEIVAGTYEEAGFDEVILTPRSGDGGRDVIATKRGIGSICFFDDVKAYKPGHLVTAKEVRAMLGVIYGRPNVSKGIITTTSDFAPGVMSDPGIKPFMPNRIELRGLNALLSLLAELPDGRGKV